MKKLSNTAKFHIFNAASLVVIIVNTFVHLWYLDLLWTVLWGIGVFFWGKESGARDERRKRTINVFIGKDLVH